jgi:hypothetical protein
MDKKKLVNGVVLLGIGLSLTTFGIYVRISLAGNFVYGPLMSMKILAWSAIMSGIIMMVIGGIRIKKGTKGRGNSR